MPNFADGYALIIGVANYAKISSLSDKVLNDARSFASVIGDPLYCGYPRDHIKLLLDATYSEIFDGLNWLSQVTNEASSVVIFFSGHGAHIPIFGNYLLPTDYDDYDISTTAVDSDELTKQLNLIQAERLVLILDACHSGGIGELKGNSQRGQLKAGLTQEAYDSLAIGKGRVIMAACRPDEKSIIPPDMKNSLFTAYLLEALEGAVATEEQLIRVFDVFFYASENVTTRTQTQHPILKTFVEDNFPIALALNTKSPNKKITSDSKINEQAVDSVQLRKLIIQAFNLEELDLLCSEVESTLGQAGVNIQIGTEIVGGVSLEGKVHKLITYLQRRNLLTYLVKSVAQNRPELLSELNLLL
jgi:hypothetical protein